MNVPNEESYVDVTYDFGMTGSYSTVDLIGVQ